MQLPSRSPVIGRRVKTVSCTPTLEEEVVWPVCRSKWVEEFSWPSRSDSQLDTGAETLRTMFTSRRISHGAGIKEADTGLHPTGARSSPRTIYGLETDNLT